MEEQKKLIPLQKKSESYKLTVTQELEKKIRFLCNKLPRNEWSGTLFYTIEGSFADKNLHITCRDLFLQDVGEATFTEFKDSIDLAAYIAEHNELIDCFTGILHSHNVMATLFSSTDMTTLREEGNDRNHFLSLIVNNAGNYTANVTRKVRCVSKGISTMEYKTFGDTPVVEDNNSFETDESYIEYYPLDITIEKIPETPKSELELRLEEVRANANSYINRNKTILPNPPYKFNLSDIEAQPFKEKKKDYAQLSIWDDTELPAKGELSDDYTIAYDEDHLDNTIIMNTVTQIVTGDIFSIHKPNINLESWANNIGGVYKKRFGNSESSSFKCWVDNFVDFLENEAYDEKLTAKGEDYLLAIWAYDVIVKLQEYPANEYLDAFIKSLERYLL